MAGLDINTGLKRCSACGEKKAAIEFGNNKNAADKLTERCKICKNVANKTWAFNNKDKIAKKNARWQKNNPEKVRAKKKRYRAKPDNHKKIIAYNTKYEEKKLAGDPNFKLAKALRTRINRIIKRKTRAGSAVRDLGCSIKELKYYIEQKFEAGMTWENHGIFGWHLDHIIPLASFDLTDREQFLKACHYTNLQPLWAEDNLSKGDKLDWSK